MSTAAQDIFNAERNSATASCISTDRAVGLRQAGPSPGNRRGTFGDRQDRRRGGVSRPKLVVDALRYATLQLCASKESGHPGGFASSADAYAALVMLGHTNIVTEVGHHAPGFYSAMFIDGSLEAMGIHTMNHLQERFRERDGLLGHLSGAIPGLLAPAGPLGQGQHFAMAVLPEPRQSCSRAPSATAVSASRTSCRR